MLQGQSVTLTCRVDANPPVQRVEWLRDNRIESHSYNYTISDVQESSVYACRASNGIVPLASARQPEQPASSASIFSLLSGRDQSAPSDVIAQLPVQVLYGPRVSIRSSASSQDLRLNPVGEGENLTLTCLADSSPPASEFVWTKHDDATFRLAQQTPHLVLDNVSAKDAGVYTCTAANKLEPTAEPTETIKEGSASFELFVKHRPGEASIELGQDGSVELNSRAVVQCRAKPPGYPEPKWSLYREPKRTPIKTSANGTFVVHALSFEVESKYVCQAENSLGKSSEASGQLIVTEPANLVADLKLEDSRYPGEERYIINLRALSKPEANVTWFHRSPVDGRRRALAANEMGSRFRVDTNSNPIENHALKPRMQTVTSLKFMQPLGLDDRGLYTAEFNNGISKPRVAEFKLNVYHSPPIPVAGNEILLVKQPGQEVKVKAAFELGDSVRLACRVSAYPQAKFNWYNPAMKQIVDFNKGQSDSRYQHSTRNVRDDIWESTLSFEPANEDDFGDYVCVSANFKGQQAELSDSVRILVSLMRKTVPDAPTQLEAIDASQDSITLQWFPGFDGGFAHNQFVVQFAADDGSGLSLAKRAAQLELAESEPEQPRNALHSVECGSVPCVIGQLQPRQGYTFRVQAKNPLGPSTFSDEYSSATRANLSQIPKILEASFDASRNMLHFRVESGADLLSANLDAHVEAKHSEPTELEQPEWRHQSTVPMRHERGEAYLNMHSASASAIDQLRITLCSRLNKSLCGPEYVIGMRTATSSFLHDQRGLSLSLVVSSALLVVLVAGFATTVHTCCLSGANKKADAIERVHSGSPLDNKPKNAPAPGEPKNGSTASTNSTSAGEPQSALANRLQSMDSLMMASAGHSSHSGHVNLAAGSSSDHSSDHSRQAKLDSMLPPNYNHYADRASILQEQQQQQQQYLHSAYGQASGTLLGVAGQQSAPFGYAPAGFSADAQPLSLEHHLFAGALGEPLPDAHARQAHTMWPMGDDYATSSNNYNNNALISGLAYQQPEAQQLEPAYGSLMQHQAAIYDNSANSGQFQAYLSACDEQQRASSRSAGSSSYQQEIAAAQQQMYGTLGRPINANNPNDIKPTITQTNPNQDTNQLDQQQYNSVAANGLAHSNQQLESDYGTVGGSGSGRSGRLIREIIV